VNGRPARHADPALRLADGATRQASGAAQSHVHQAVRDAGSVAVLVLADIAPASLWWGWSRLVLQRWPLRQVPGLRFSKVLGSGHAGGFGWPPSRSRQGLFLVFGDEADARRFIDASPVLAAYRAHAAELCTVLLRACSSKGSWSGAAIAVTATAPVAGLVASLSRASIRPVRAARFWRFQPAAEAALARADGCLFAAGVGEAPLLRQATFTLWRDAAAMDAYARSGAHAEAIRAAYGGGYFSESMFVRFVPLQLRGTWQGVRHG
jgi:spheroidene monooxygenase